MCFTMLLDLQTVFVSVTVILLLAWLSCSRPIGNLPPGPWGWPILGYLPNLGITLYRAGIMPYRLFARMSDNYGKVYSLYMGRKLVVVLNDYESIRDAFRNPLLIDRPKINAFPDGDLGIILSSGKLWQFQRRFTLSQFRNLGIGKSSFQDKISEETNFLLQEFNVNAGKAIDPSKYLSNAMSNIICSVIFGKRFRYSDEDFKRIIELLDRQFELAGSGGIMLFVPIFHHLQPNLKRLSHQTNSQLRSFIHKIVEEHKKDFDKCNLNDYIHIFLGELELASKPRSNGLLVTEDNLINTVIQLFVAGSETTVAALRWSLLYMIAFPDIQSRVQQEIDSVVGRNRLPRLKDNLAFTEATIMEVQRCASVTPLGAPHLAAQDTTLQSYTIPKGALIISNLWAVHHDPAVWKDPDQFRPHRFLDMNGNVQPQRKEFIPFSIGHRKCLGDNLAKMELFIVFTHLLHQFTFKKPPDVTDISLEGSLGASNTPKPFQIVAIKRN